MKLTDAESDKKIESIRAKFSAIDAMPAAFLNSVPKCGTMLVRNIFRMFWDAKKTILPFADAGSIYPMSQQARPDQMFFCGHVDFSPFSGTSLRGMKKIILVRHPEDYCLSYARFILSKEAQERSALFKVIGDHQLSFGEIVRLTITGFHYQNDMIPSVQAQFVSKALAWCDHETYLVRYEDLVFALRDMESEAAGKIFGGIFEFLQIPLPDDWRLRVTAGAAKGLSTTHPKNLTFTSSLEDRTTLLPDERRLLNVVAPGLCEALGYS